MRVWPDALMQALGALPLPVLRGLGRVVGAVLYAVVPQRRRVVLTNLRLCFPHWSEALRRQVARAVFVRFAQARARHLHGRRQNLQRLVLAKHHALEVPLQGFELVAIVTGDAGRRNTSNLRNDIFHLSAGDGFLLLAFGQDALGRARFINHINGFVWQMPVVDVFGRQFGRRRQRRSAC